METITRVQGIIQNDFITDWAGAFLLDKKAGSVSPGTLRFYQKKLHLFLDYCQAQVLTHISQLTPTNLRQYLVHLAEQGHNPGGVHACYRVLKAWLRWYWAEVEPAGRNPIDRVTSPKVPEQVLDPVSSEIVRAMLATCERGTFYGSRDRAMILFLLDTGARAQEALDVNLEDLDIATGTVTIRQGKGRKARKVFIGKTTRRAIRAYMRERLEFGPVLWVSSDGERLTYSGLRSLMVRRAKMAKVDPPTLHSFRRAFALAMLRAGVDVYSLQALMGHADLQVLKRYLKLTGADLKAAHHQGGPVNGGLLDD
jgi:integrase/recombinase XerD